MKINASVQIIITNQNIKTTLKPFLKTFKYELTTLSMCQCEKITDRLLILLVTNFHSPKFLTFTLKIKYK